MPGESVGRGVILIETTPKPPVAQRAGGIYIYMYIYIYLYIFFFFVLVAVSTR